MKLKMIVLVAFAAAGYAQNGAGPGGVDIPYQPGVQPNYTRRQSVHQSPSGDTTSQAMPANSGYPTTAQQQPPARPSFRVPQMTRRIDWQALNQSLRVTAPPPVSPPIVAPQVPAEQPQ